MTDSYIYVILIVDTKAAKKVKGHIKQQLQYLTKLIHCWEISKSSNDIYKSLGMHFKICFLICEDE